MGRMNLFPLARRIVLLVYAPVFCSTALLALPVEERPVGQLEGVITRANTPVGGATVEIRLAADDRIVARATTGRTGRFAFSLAEGTYDVEVHPSSTYSRGGRAEHQDLAAAYQGLLNVGVI